MRSSFCRTLSLAVALIACRCDATPAQRQPAIQTEQEFRRAIYAEVPMLSNGGTGADACVRLLNATGTSGCGTPNVKAAEGRLLRLDALLPHPEDYPDNVAVLLPPALLPAFLGQCATSAALARRVRGVLLEPGPPPEYSDAEAAPLAAFALYTANRSYAWNPAGAGLSALDLPFPLFLLDEASAAEAARRAAANSGQGDGSPLHHARMAAEMDGAGNSSACLAAATCLPLGGHSVLAALPPLPPPGAPDDGLPALWLLAQADSTALFHEAAAGADAAVSGLVALLAAAELLGGAAGGGGGGVPLRRRLVFAALAGEPWGLMGSKRLLWEAQQGNSSVAGLPLERGRVAGVLEVSQVGRAAQEGPGAARQLFAHTPKTDPGPAAHAELLTALQAAAAATEGVSVAPAGPQAPGLPPTASAGSFVRVGDPGRNGSLPAALLAGFDSAFRGSAFQSGHDTLAALDADSIAQSAAVLARAAYVLAAHGGGGAAAARAAAAALPVDPAAVKVRVESLLQCLLNSTLGLSCPLAAGMMSAAGGGGRTGHYIGILRTLTADPQVPDPAVKSDAERFVWNFLAFALTPDAPRPPGWLPGGGGGGAALRASSLQPCQPMNATGCPVGHVCAGARGLPGPLSCWSCRPSAQLNGAAPAPYCRPEGRGVCLRATVRYVPAYSTSLACDGCDGGRTAGEQRWRLTAAAADWERRYGWPPDPLWTESNWPEGQPALTLFLREADGVESALLAAGVAVAAVSAAVVQVLKAAHSRKLKRQ